MDLTSQIAQARQYIQDLPEGVPWRGSVLQQLAYCEAVSEGTASPEKLENLNMGLISVREMDDADEVASLIRSIQSELQEKYLSYAAKVRLGIHKR